MYGVVAHFDEESERYIKEVWKELSDQAISTYAEEVIDRRPHITFASYQRLEIDRFIPLLQSCYESSSKLPITLSSLGTFMNTGMIFLAPTPSIELLALHMKHHQMLEEFNDQPASLYLPTRWIPHCTVANRLPMDKLKEAFEYCTKRMKPIDAQMSEVALIKVVDEGRESSRVETIKACPLR
ncbi:2'-5' RNA ligase family protein [Heyndrickxia oleronia]|uniref:2'-5' RNA ligase family protein n=1 Tax=Heyndrickxia oleronia TaxID=38875 RepID=UPI001B1CC5AD|nr:2'-5' RNA ligase family protein [Heyndrickxia oleronia]GIN40694.1 hypothetical protein J19TS1_36430 [Heyndrickxia oleronia]